MAAEDDEEPTDILGMVLGKAEPEDDADEGDAKTRAIEDLFAAMKKGDAKAGAAAFERAYEACAAKHEAEEESAEAPGDDAEEYAEA